MTALLGLIIFGEKLPPLWWVGAGLLAAGNVVIGRREEGEKPVGKEGLESREDGGLGRREGVEEGEGVPLMQDEYLQQDDMIDQNVDVARSESTKEATKKGEDADAPLR